MSKLISGKEALIALANGEAVEVKRIHDNEWQPAQIFGVSVFTDSETTSFRIKPRTIKLNGIEIPAPFEPKARQSGRTGASSWPRTLRPGRRACRTAL